MKLGVPKEIKADEYRVGLVPASVRELVNLDHEVFVQTNAGNGIGVLDEHYQDVGAKICKSAQEIFAQAELIVKVKEPLENERKMLKKGQAIFTFLHLAPDLKQTQDLLSANCIAIGYETVTDAYGRLPLLYPMSVVAGRMAIQAGSHALEKNQGGKGILLGGVPGVEHGNVVVIGGGVVGSNAVRIAVGMEAHVTVIDKSIACLEKLDAQFGASLNTIFATTHAVEHYVMEADLVIGAVLVPGSSAPRLVTHEMVKKMRPGSVLVDVSIDQGGCFETSKPTTHSHPTFVQDSIVHYCVTNMPGATPRTSTFALNNATLPFILDLANKGIKTALLEDKHLLNGLNVYEGKITHPAVAKALSMDYFEPGSLLS